MADEDGQNGGDNGAGAVSPDGAGADGNGVPQGDVTGARGDAAAPAGDDPSTWTYDVQLPEGFGLGDEQIEAWTSALREAGVKPEQAQKLIEFEAQMYEQSMEAQQATIDGYAKRIEADKFLSENWDLTVQRMSAGIEHVGASDEFRALLESPEGVAIATIPEVIKAFAMIGKMATNDTFEGGRASEDAEPSYRSWYGNTTPQSKKG